MSHRETKTCLSMSTNDHFVDGAPIPLDQVEEQLSLLKKSIELSHARLVKLAINDFFVRMFIKEIRETEDYLIRLIGQQIIMKRNTELNETSSLIGGKEFLVIVGVDPFTIESIPFDISVDELISDTDAFFIERNNLKGQNARKVLDAIKMLKLYLADCQSNNSPSYNNSAIGLYHWDSFNTEALKSPSMLGDELFNSAFLNNEKVPYHRSNISLYQRPGTPISSDGMNFGSSTDLSTKSDNSGEFGSSDWIFRSKSESPRSENKLEKSDETKEKCWRRNTNSHKWGYVCKIATCDYCQHRISVLGLRCKECRLRCHSKCEKFISPTCGANNLLYRDQRHVSSTLPNRWIFNRYRSQFCSDIKRAIKKPGIEVNHDIQPGIKCEIEDNVFVENEPKPSVPGIALFRKPHHDELYLSRQHASVPIMCQISIDLDDGSALQRQVTLSTSLKEWDIPIDTILIEERVYQGEVSTIYRASWYGPVALRLIDLNTFGQYFEQKLRLFKLEVATLKKLRHENLILFCGACLQPPRIGIVTSWINGCSLFHRLHIANDDPLEENHILNFAHQIIMALRYLHSKRCIHKALRSKNVFIEHNDKVIVTDYGLSINNRTCSSAEKYLAIPTYWLLYYAPELIVKLTGTGNTDIYHTKESDIYAFGVIFYEMMTQNIPFYGMSNHTIIWKV
ncbi:hypothetical protein ACOME3_003486 [Neoechinorhynchus agilis]